MIKTFIFSVLMLIVYGDAVAGSMTKTIREVKAEHESAMLAIDGVVSMGVGKDADGNPCLVVGVKNAAAAAKIPEHLDGYSVVVKNTGEIDAF